MAAEMSFSHPAVGSLGKLPETLITGWRHYSGEGASQLNKWKQDVKEHIHREKD